MNNNPGCKLFILVALAFLYGCAGEEEPQQKVCTAPEGMVLTDIDSVTDWVNAMPKPVSLPCFLQTLPRPLFHNATVSNISAQVSVGERSPRTFLAIDKLIFTVVPDEVTARIKDPVTGAYTEIWDADGIRLLEMSYEVESEYLTRQSIKAELKFPVTELLPRSAPYDKIHFSETTSTCAFCHGDETRIDVIEGVPVYRSEMLRNSRNNEITIQKMMFEQMVCDPGESKKAQYRCEMLDAIYDQGELVWFSFPLELPTLL